MTLLNASRKSVGVLLACVVVSVSLTACGSGSSEQGMSASLPVEDSVQSQVGSPDDVVAMSGIYEVTREGKLLRYASLPPAEKPELTELARVHDNNGAEEFARYFIRVMEYTWNSGDSSLLREISLPSCTWCEHMASTTDERAANKGWVEGNRPEIESIETAFELPEEPGLWNVAANVENPKHRVYTGFELKEVAAKKNRLYINLRYTDGSWKLDGVAADEAE